MTLEEQIEKERERNYTLAIEIEKLRAQMGVTVPISDADSLFHQSKAFENLKRMKKESDERLAALKSEMQDAARSDAGLTQTQSESVSVHDKKAEPVQETVDRAITTKPPRGPKPKMEYHKAIAAIVNPYGDDWQTESNLDKIAAKLDRKNAKTPPPLTWTTRNRPAHSWGRAVQNFRELVIKKISYSLKMAARVPGN